MIGATLILYLLIGLVVTVAMARRAAAEGRVVEHVVWWLLWPFVAPLLFDAPAAPPVGADPVALARAELRAAVADLPATTRRLIADEIERVLSLTEGMSRLATGVADIDAVLATPSFDRAAADATLSTLEARGCAATDHRVLSVRGRLANIDRLEALRTRRAADLESALLTLQALTSEVRLLTCAVLSRDETPAAIAQVTALVRALAEGLFAPDEALV